MKISELKGKHDHALTNWLKVIIFSLLMIAPLFASISQWVYVACNKNAKDSYSTKNISNTTLVNPNANLAQGLTYFLKWGEKQGSNNGTRFYYSDITIDWTQYGAPSGINYNSFSTYNAGGQNWYLYLHSANQDNEYTFWEAQSKNFEDFNMTLSQNVTLNGVNEYSIYYFLTEKDTLDNAFYYGVEKMTQSDLFNWTQNTTLYTGIKTMTDNLEIQTPAIAILLTYWFILTIIYVIIDIVLKGFTTLTHLIIGAKN